VDGIDEDRLAVGVEAFVDFEVGELGDVFGDGIIMATPVTGLVIE
jgi:hypothetical protein